MTSYFIRRLFLIIPTFLGITFLVFLITRFVPGGPVERFIVETQDTAETKTHFGSGILNAEQLADLNKYYGLDKPVLVGYRDWLFKVVRLDLGESTRYGDSVWETIKSRLPVSATFGFLTLTLTYLICIPLGIIKAVRHGKLIDKISSVFIFTGHALPSYVIAIVLFMVFCARLEWFPLGGFTSVKHMVMPLASYLIGSCAVMTMLMKNSLVDNLSTDYVRTAVAKGAGFKLAVLKHGLRNSLIPIATSFGSCLSFVIAGSFFIEKIFNIDGFGLLGFDAIINRDYPVVMGILVVSSLLQFSGNIISDICVALLDPRVQFK